ncbi:unnamed protein product [Adineta steineri]|uniref:Uncharacterized protein n=2 Tax=Adineta steineri TaxID=433720 RepID=A0A819JTJ8_9BILA|nr:unnamed protein product [Adineta steineri]
MIERYTLLKTIQAEWLHVVEDVSDDGVLSAVGGAATAETVVVAKTSLISPPSPTQEPRATTTCRGAAAPAAT